MEQNNKTILSSAKPKKILIFSTAYFPFVGGAEVAVREITDLLGGEGGDFSAQGETALRLEFDMVTVLMDRKLPKFEKMGNVNVYRFGIGVKFLDKYLLALFGHSLAQKLHDEKHYDAVWGIMASYGGFAASVFKKRNPDVPFLLTLQEGDPISFIKLRALPMWFAFKNIFKRADYVQAISNYLANWAKEMKVRCPIEVVPNGVDMKGFFEEDTEEKRESKIRAINFHFTRKFKTPEESREKPIPFKEKGDILIVTTSRLVKKNAVDDIIKSLSSLQNNFKLLIMGDGSEKPHLEKIERDLNLEKRVLFLQTVSYKAIASYLATADVFVRPSRSEGLGNSFLEAMAAGVPIIGTKVGGIPDFLKDGETGLFCEVNNPKSIAEKVLWLTDPKNETQKSKIITNAKKLVQEKYDWNLIAGKMKEIFEKLINKKYEN